MRNKIKLGIFVAIGLLGIMISIFALGNLNFGRTYDVYVLFQNASGLPKKAKVKVAGVDVGVLSKIELKNAQASLRLSIDRDIVLYENASAAIVSMGIIGTKYVEIKPGDSSYPVLKHGRYLQTISGAGSIEEVLGNIAKKLDSALDNERNGDMMQNLSDAINNFKDFSKNLAQITYDNKEDLRASIANMKEISEKLDIIVAKINEGDGTLAKLLNDEEMGKDLKETVASAKETVENLKETIGTGRKLQLTWDYTGRYNIKDAKYRNDIGIGMSLRKERFYYVGISNVADSKNEENEKEKDTMNKLNAWIGFRSENAQIYGGVIKGKGGVGAGVSFFDPIYAPHRRVQLHVDAYDFGRKKYGPEIDAGVRFGLTKWLYAGVMVEDISYSAGVTPYIKLEIKDTDIAALLGIAGLAAVASK